MDWLPCYRWGIQTPEAVTCSQQFKNRKQHGEKQVVQFGFFGQIKWRIVLGHMLNIQTLSKADEREKEVCV